MALKTRKMSAKGEKILLYVIGLLLVLALCYFFIISKAGDRNKPIKDDILKVKKQLVEVQNIDNEIENKRTQLQKLDEKYNEASKELPKTDRYPQVYKDEETLAKECNLTLMSARFNDPEVVKTVDNSVSTNSDTDASADTSTANKFTGMKSMTVEYTFSGTFDDVMQFVDKLENGSRIADVLSVQQGTDGFKVTVAYFASGGETDEKEEYDFN